MSDDTGIITRPSIPPELINILNKIKDPIMKIKVGIDKVKDVNARNGIYAGIFLSVLTLLSSLSIYRTVIAFILAFIVVSLISAIIKFIEKTTKYTIGQRIGIAIGFALLFMFCAIIIVLIDTQIGNPVYTILTMLTSINNGILKDLASSFFKSSKDSSKVFFDQITELLRLKTAEDRSIFMGCLIKYLGALLAIVLIGIAMFKATNDPTAMNRNAISYAMLMIVPLLISFFIFSPMVNAEDMSLLSILGGGFIFLMIAIYIYYCSSWTPNSIYYSSYLMNALLFTIIIVGLGIVFKVFSGQVKKLSGWPGFFANLFFFIPCLLSDAVQYIFYQFKITPNIVILLLFIEIILIVLYACVPLIIDKISKSNTSTLVSRPMFINRAIPIGDSSLFLMNPIDDSNVNSQTYRTNYAFSMWIYLNQHSSANSSYTNSANIFDFGNGKPTIAFKNESTNTRLINKDVYIITFTNTSVDASNNQVDTNYEISLPNQKWNNFVFNYIDSKVDLYINGSLERTFEFANNVPNYLPTDVITVGSNNGLQGAICNINYYKTPISSETIVSLYNLLFMKNPPLNL
jgi:hypothetical protein